jgi:hypothetical protein
MKLKYREGVNNKAEQDVMESLYKDLKTEFDSELEAKDKIIA